MNLSSSTEKYVIFNNDCRKYIITPKGALDIIFNENRK